MVYETVTATYKSAPLVFHLPFVVFLEFLHPKILSGLAHVNRVVNFAMVTRGSSFRLVRILTNYA